MEHVEIVGTLQDGQFLEGIDLANLSEFEEWLREQRAVIRTSSRKLSHSSREPDSLLPAIAVLPFLSSQNDSEDIPLGDMLAEEVSRSLSKSHFARIKSHFSCRSIDARRVVLNELTDLLGTDYVVSGLLYCRAERFFLKVDLVDVASGEFIWSTEFSGCVNEFFAGQSTVAADIALAVSKTLLRRSFEIVSAEPLPDTKSHCLFMSSIALLHKQDIASSARSRAYFEELARRAPNSSLVHSWLGLWYVLCLSQGWHDNTALDASRAKDCTAKALDLNPTCSFSLAVDAVIENNVLKNYDEALNRFDFALDLDPNNAYGRLFSGVARAFQGDHERAVEDTQKSRFLSPLDPGAYLFDTLSATAELSAMNFENALRLAERSYQRNPMHNSTLRVRTIALHGLGRLEEARQSAEELATREPNLTIEGYRRSHPAAAFETGRRWAEALEESGIRKS
ncbi:tetratricopeptide repeat protein [Ruegeria hyattellae]|uniref:tetratricopeptide repeat protein n=1 Tax=Ruegeria hyattellae TaxID=3233337 RepID=UPI00355BF237